MKTSNIRPIERGAVSLFIVIFTALLVTIIAVSFTQLMIKNQQQVTANDLSQRAYNSALAGVEDAKRTLIMSLNACRAGSPKCETINNAISAQNCNTIQSADVGTHTNTDSGGNKETTVGDSSGGDNQAYTCVKITRSTPNYQGKLDPGNQSLVPLRSSENFSKVRLTWFTKADIQGSGEDRPSFFQDADPTKVTSLPPVSSWPSTAPPILRAQYIPGQTALADLDTKALSTFLYPKNNFDQMGGDPVALNADSRRDAQGGPPHQVNCVDSFGPVFGVCQVTLELPHQTKSAYLQLASIYGSASFTVELLGAGDSVVNFDNVQPIIDSTGRADDLFRRVQARVTVKDGVSYPYPDAAISVQNDLCKTFFITNNKSDYGAGTCDPAKQTLPVTPSP